ncbi:MAG: hypothetical protein SV760_09310, partial [Halobacteria archaeon]|nr:hypothetical protein [Halobacteria archaeon]
TVSKPFSYSSSFEESPPTPETEFRGNTSSQEDSEPLTVATPNGTSSNTPIEPPVDPRKKWRTRQKALETLRSRYNSTANRLGANFSLTLESYTFRNVTVESGFGAPENKSLLDISYRVKFTDVKKGLVDSLARNLSNSTEYDVSRETAEELARKISEVSLNRLMFRSVSEGSSFDARWKVDISNYSGALTSYLKLLSEMEREKRVFSGNVFASSLRRTRKTIEAMKAANLVTKLTWSFDVEPTTSSVSIDGNISRTARNWGSYVDELRSRGLETPADTRLNLDVGKEEGRVQGVLNWSATEKEILKQRIDSMLRYFKNGTKRSKALRKLRGSEFEKAKMVASIDDGNWSFEAGARFGNGNALSEAIQTATDLEVTEVVGRNEGDGFTTYVKVSGLVGQTTEEAVRALNVTSDETKVLLPGEWDRGFPTMDAQSANEFLSSEEKSPLLGFGFAVSFVALAVVAVFILRRRR